VRDFKRHAFADATRPLYSSTDLAGLAGDTVDTGDKTFAYQLLARLADRSELCEFRTMYADALVCGWIRLAGAVVGVVCATGRPITRSSAESACQLVQMCSEARIPLLVVQRCVHDGWTAYTSGEHTDASAKCNAYGTRR
jgi:geranyl-CoA carboxylase beta subunit